MRNLTITRTKTFVGCAVSLKVYIEDELGPLPINGVNCRLLGKIKNGETQTYEIDSAARRVYIIADKLSKNYCNEFYPIPAGEEDVSLSGRPHYNPATGNAFRFDGVVDPEVLANRKKGSGKGLVVLIIAAIVGFVLGFVITSGIFGGLGDPEDFTCKGLTITLTDKFERDKEIEAENLDCTAVYNAGEVAAILYESPLAEFPGVADKSARAFAELCATTLQLGSNAVRTENGLCYYEYPAPNPEVTQLAFFYKSESAFWEIRFLVMTEDLDEMRPKVMEWAGSVTFAE